MHRMIILFIIKVIGVSFDSAFVPQKGERSRSHSEINLRVKTILNKNREVGLIVISNVLLTY